MQKLLLALAGAGLIVLGGCQGSAGVKPEESAKAEAPQVTISAEAKQALAKAEADVKEAKAKDALWTTAADSLKDAKAAAAKGDSAKVLKEAKEASEHAQLGIKQLSYAPTNK
jgi:murein lipoprotein